MLNKKSFQFLPLFFFLLLRALFSSTTLIDSISYLKLTATLWNNCQEVICQATAAAKATPPPPPELRWLSQNWQRKFHLVIVALKEQSCHLKGEQFKDCESRSVQNYKWNISYSNRNRFMRILIANSITVIAAVPTWSWLRAAASVPHDQARHLIALVVTVSERFHGMAPPNLLLLLHRPLVVSGSHHI